MKEACLNHRVGRPLFLCPRCDCSPRCCRQRRTPYCLPMHLLITLHHGNKRAIGTEPLMCVSSINPLKPFGGLCPICPKAEYSGWYFRRPSSIATTLGTFANSWSASAS